MISIIASNDHKCAIIMILFSIHKIRRIRKNKTKWIKEKLSLFKSQHNILFFYSLKKKTWNWVPRTKHLNQCSKYQGKKIENFVSLCVAGQWINEFPYSIWTIDMVVAYSIFKIILLSIFCFLLLLFRMYLYLYCSDSLLFIINLSLE